MHNKPPILAENDDSVSYLSRKSGASSRKNSLKTSMSGAKSSKNRRQLTILGKDGKALHTPSNQG
jgi:hypothetical protein